MGNVNTCPCGKKVSVTVQLLSPDTYTKEDVKKAVEDIERETSLTFDTKGFILSKSLCNQCYNNKFNLRKTYFIVRGWKVNTIY